MAAKKNTETKTSEAAGKKVELKDKATGFFDPVTGFKIVHDQQAKLGDTVGKKTNKALLSGALLIVGSPEAKAAADAETTEE